MKELTEVDDPYVFKLLLVGKSTAHIGRSLGGNDIILSFENLNGFFVQIVYLFVFSVKTVIIVRLSIVTIL